jgi:hypothetical protein
MMDVAVGQWDTGQGSGMCDIIDVVVGQWDTGQVGGMCVT